jgi:ArsR family transcriptional regulator, nickel/cobalt-responsive transcriptional repressor
MMGAGPWEQGPSNPPRDGTTRMDESLEPDRCARLLKSVADPERLRIIDCLRDGPMNVSELAARLGDEVVNVSHHLGVLRQSGLVLDEKQGRFVVYRLHPDVYQSARAPGNDYLNFGCCRIEIPKGDE